MTSPINVNYHWLYEMHKLPVKAMVFVELLKAFDIVNVNMLLAKHISFGIARKGL